MSARWCVLLVAALACTLLGAEAASAAVIDGRTVTVHAPSGPERGRVILLHGLTGSHAFGEIAPARDLLTGLQRKGYRVITPDLPYPGAEQATRTRARITRDADGGAAYMRGWRRYFHAIVTWAARRYGPARRLLVGGVSWGGFHAMHAACDKRAVTGWFAISPVVDPTMLGEFAALDMGAMSLDGCAGRLRALPGSMSYGDADARVGVEPQRRLAGLLAGGQVRVKRYHGLGHETTPAAIRRIVRWVP